MSERAKLAVNYAKNGFRIVMLHGINKKGHCTCKQGANCDSSGKHPIYKGWESKATSNEAEIIAAFQRHPAANIGFCTGDQFFAVDIDVKSNGYNNLLSYGRLGDTVSVTTGSGGSHHYYLLPKDLKVPNLSSLIPGVDLRSKGGLVVAPGSAHQSGSRYEWKAGCSPEEIAIAEPDVWLCDLIANAATGKTLSHELPAAIEEGTRNSVMASLAGALRRKGLSYEAILAALLVENESRCDPPLSDHEIETIARSISRYKPEDPVRGLEWSEMTQTILIDRMEGLTDYAKVYDAETLALLALAKKQAPVVYAKLKTRLKGKVNLNDLEKAIKHQERQIEPTDFHPMLQLTGLEEMNLIVPYGWKVSQQCGVTRLIHNGDGSQREVSASFVPVILSRRFQNLDIGSEKIELSFYRDRHWKKVLAPRSVVFNRNNIIRLADNSFPVTSNNSGDLISYLTDFEQANDLSIPVVKSVSRLGWISNREFFPFITEEALEFETDSKEAATVMAGVVVSGDENKWLEMARSARKNSAARFIIAASLSSVLLELLHKRVFFIHLWHSSRSGKTATLKLAIAAWGNTHKLIGSFNSTVVGLERLASSLRNLPFAIDELQVLNTKRMTPDSIIYMLSQGQGRTRGARDGGLQETMTWRNIVLTTGEEALLGSSMQDGANSRTFELYAQPVDDIALAADMHGVSEENYGHAGKKFVTRLCEELTAGAGFLQPLYDEMKSKLKGKYPDNIHLDEVTVVCLGDYLSSQYVFGENPGTAMEEAIQTVCEMLENNRQLTQTDNIERAWEVFSGWLIGNSARFSYSAPSPQYGRLDEKSNYLVIPSFAHQAMEEAGFSSKKVFRGFAERGYIESQVDSDGIRRLQLGRNLMGKTARVYVVKVPDYKQDKDNSVS